MRKYSLPVIYNAFYIKDIKPFLEKKLIVLWMYSFKPGNTMRTTHPCSTHVVPFSSPSDLALNLLLIFDMTCSSNNYLLIPRFPMCGWIIHCNNILYINLAQWSLWISNTTPRSSISPPPSRRSVMVSFTSPEMYPPLVSVLIVYIELLPLKNYEI